MDENNLADINEAPAASPDVSVNETPAPSQEKDPVQAELERVESKPKRSKLEQLEYTKRRVEQQLEEERRKAGIVDENDDSRPLTVGDLKRIREEEAVETALNLAESLENEHERRLTKYHLENTIRPSGDAQTDLKNALALVNAVKNQQKAEDAGRAQVVRRTASSAGAPPKEKANDDLTPEEVSIMTAFHLTKEEVIAQRPK